jgi:hypothetical protein
LVVSPMICEKIVILDQIVKKEIGHIESIQVFKPSGESQKRQSVFQAMIDLEEQSQGKHSPLLKCLNFLRSLTEARRDLLSKFHRQARVNFELKKALQVIGV